jgi:hypothetical protein
MHANPGPLASDLVPNRVRRASGHYSLLTMASQDMNRLLLQVPVRLTIHRARITRHHLGFPPARLKIWLRRPLVQLIQAPHFHPMIGSTTIKFN